MPDSFTVIADLGTYSRTHPPCTPFDVPTGLQFALEPVAGGFLVSDGHHNRILRVSHRGSISELIGFDNVVPGRPGRRRQHGVHGGGGPGPAPPGDRQGRQLPPARHGRDGRGLRLQPDRGCGARSTRALFALSQGDSPGVVPPASPALPDSGELLRVNRDGSFSVVVDHLDLPTSLHFIRDTAFVVTQNGEVWRIPDVR